MTLHAFLQRSAATEPFRQAVEAFLRGGRASERIAFQPYSPAVKVERTLTKVLEAYPDLPIERVEVDGASGCEYFRGTVTVHAGDEVRRVRFHWDCKWRAEQQGWRDYFGFADQGRAAREFGHDCFRGWEEVQVVRLDAPVVSLQDEPLPAPMA